MSSGGSAAAKPARPAPKAPTKGTKTCPWFGDKCKFLPSGKCTHTGPPPSGGPPKAKTSPSPATAGASPEVLAAMRNLKIAQRGLELALAGSAPRPRPSPPHGGHVAPAHLGKTGVQCKFDRTCTRADCWFEHTKDICRHHLRGLCKLPRKDCAFRHPS